jgi:hypothetical protein
MHRDGDGVLLDQDIALDGGDAGISTNFSVRSMCRVLSLRTSKTMTGLGMRRSPSP